MAVLYSPSAHYFSGLSILCLVSAQTEHIYDTSYITQINTKHPLYRRPNKWCFCSLYPNSFTKPSASLEVTSSPLVQVFDGQTCSQQTLQLSLILEWLSGWELGNCSLLCLSPHLLTGAQSHCRHWSSEAKRRPISVESEVGSVSPQQL